MQHATWGMQHTNNLGSVSFRRHRDRRGSNWRRLWLYLFCFSQTRQIYELHEQHVCCKLQAASGKLQLHFVAINIIMRRLLAPIGPAPVPLSLLLAMQIINLR